jgi:dihydroflavonol-4-reductase
MRNPETTQRRRAGRGVHAPDVDGGAGTESALADRSAQAATRRRRPRAEKASVVAITGANGLLGANLVRHLERVGRRVRAIVRATSDRRSLEGSSAEIVCTDVRDESALRVAFRDCTLVFHAATPFVYWGVAPAELEAIATDGTRALLRAAREAGVRRVALTSSSVVLGSRADTRVLDETSITRAEELRAHDRLQEAPPYFRVKALQERVFFDTASELGLETVALYPGIMVGRPDYRLVPSNGMIVQYMQDPFRSTFPGGCNIVHASDVARGHLLAAEKGANGERYFLGSENWEWTLVHRTIAELCGLPPPLLHVGRAGSYLAATAMEVFAHAFGTTPAVTREQALTVGRFYWYSHAKAAQLGYAPRPARTAIADAVAWLLHSPHVSQAAKMFIRPSAEVEDAERSAAFAYRA